MAECGAVDMVIGFDSLGRVSSALYHLEFVCLHAYLYYLMDVNCILILLCLILLERLVSFSHKMKLTLQTLSLLFFFFLLLLSSSEPSTGRFNPLHPPVCDITHSPLSTDIKYYILPVIRGRGGGLIVSTENCPPAVIQDPFEVSWGLPVTFAPFDGVKGVIRESTDINIKFSSSGHLNLTSCKESTVWRVDGYDEKTRQWYVTTGGVEGNPGRQTVSNWFKIDKFGDDYKLVFCPNVCSFCKVVCKDVGVYVEKGGRRRLVLSDEAFRVMFKKA